LVASLLIADSFAVNRGHWSANIDLPPHTNGVEAEGAPSLLRENQTSFGLRPESLPQLKMHLRSIDGPMQR